MKDVKHYQAFLEAVTQALKENAAEALTEMKSAPRNSKDYSYESGRRMAYYDAITIMMQQAEAMEIPLPAFEGLNPDKDLL